MATQSDKRRKLFRIILVATSTLLAQTLVLLEIVARCGSARVEVLTTHGSVRGRFACHSHIPFVLNPGYECHSSMGFRSPEISPEKLAGTRRLVCVGASTTYGLYVRPEEAWPGQFGEMLRAEHGSWEVINPGVPGWVSTDSLINLMLRIFPLQPDLVVLYHDSNELFSHSYSDYKPDHTHYGRPGFNFTVTNYEHKFVFGYSHLAILPCTLRGVRLGWSELEEHPLFGGLIHENRPTADELRKNLQDASCLEIQKRSQQALASVCKAHGIRLVFTTMAFVPEKLATTELDKDLAMLGPLTEQLQEDNTIVREAVGEAGVTLVDTASLAKVTRRLPFDARRPPPPSRDCIRSGQRAALVAPRFISQSSLDYAL